MTTIRWLATDDGPGSLPDAVEALDEPNGLVAAGGSLAPDWLLTAYVKGLFPWYEAGQPILWWSPNPRSVLRPAALRVSRSLRRRIAGRPFELTADTAFDAVVAGCAAPRDYTDATWITPEMAAAYARLHALGYAHSFEAWRGGELVGGLYGVAIGGVFFGESMFARADDASKVAFVAAVRFLESRGVELIDCQVATAHLTRLGAVPMPRHAFVAHLREHCRPAAADGSFAADFGARAGA